MADEKPQTPETGFRHEGMYSVQFDPAFRSSMLFPQMGTVDEATSTLTVRQGSLEARKAGVQFASSGEQFFWPYRRIRAIKNGGGEVIWENPNPDLS